jgi:hypothetical protein
MSMSGLGDMPLEEVEVDDYHITESWDDSPVVFHGFLITMVAKKLTNPPVPSPTQELPQDQKNQLY